MDQEQIIIKIAELVRATEDLPRSREASLAITKLEEAALWLGADYVREKTVKGENV